MAGPPPGAAEATAAPLPQDPRPPGVLSTTDLEPGPGTRRPDGVNATGTVAMTTTTVRGSTVALASRLVGPAGGALRCAWNGDGLQDWESERIPRWLAGGSLDGENLGLGQKGRLWIVAFWLLTR